jgi:hypothetical protein
MKNKYSRTYTFCEKYLSCKYCDLNYIGGTNEPGFCQEYSIDNLDTWDDTRLKEKAVNCLNFVPRPSRVDFGSIRTMMSNYGDNHKRWYEED